MEVYPIVEMVGYPGYGVSADGRVWSKWVRCGKPVPWKIVEGAWSQVKPGPSGFGYLSVELRNSQGKTRRLIHLLVLETFVGPKPSGMECRHYDGDRHNNHLTNLSWGTRQQNADDRERHGTSPVGERNPRARLCERDIVEIFAMKRSGMKPKEIAAKKCVAMITIQKILQRNLWSHVVID